MSTDSDFLYLDDSDPFADEIEPCCHDCGERLLSETECTMNLCDGCLSEHEYQAYQAEQNVKAQTVQEVERIVNKMTLYIPSDLRQEWDKTLSKFLVAHQYQMPMTDFGSYIRGIAL